MKIFVLIVFLMGSKRTFSKIEYKVYGNNKTDHNIIEIEIRDILEKKALNPIDLKELKRRIWNLRIFSNVNIELVKDNEIIIRVEERWTTIPIAKFSGGGGSSYFALGIYDINSFGQNKEMGIQYESLNNRPAGVVWTRIPQFLNNRNLSFGIDIWSINRIRIFYDSISRENIGALTLERKRFNLFSEIKWDNDFYRLGFQYDYHIDKISNFGLDQEQLQINEENKLELDKENINRWHSVYFHIGRLNYSNYLLDGGIFTFKTSLINSTERYESNLTYNESSFKYFKLFKNHHNIGWNFKFISHNLSQIQNLSYVGGFGEVRGYMDGQFYGNSSWQNNLEYRMDLYNLKNIVLQGAIFSDQGNVGDDVNNIFNKEDDFLLSSGFGVRFISPRIYRFVGRLDFSQTHTRSISQNVSFGIQQFF